MQVTFIGGGNMATALIGGLIRQGVAASGIHVVELLPEARAKLVQEFGVTAVASVESLAAMGDVVVFAVKPQQMREAAMASASRIGHAVVLTIAAGIRLVDLGRWLGAPSALVRCMPNTPALIGEGITGAYATPATSVTQRESVERILRAGGKVVWVDAEDLLDPVTAVSGSGPAYIFYFIEAMEAAAIEMGIAPETARALTLQTFRGATELAERSIESPAVLRARVTSKGGTTERALASFDENRVQEAIRRGIHAANSRARELAEQFGKDA